MGDIGDKVPRSLRLEPGPIDLWKRKRGEEKKRGEKRRGGKEKGGKREREKKKGKRKEEKKNPQRINRKTIKENFYTSCLLFEFTCLDLPIQTTPKDFESYF